MDSWVAVCGYHFLEMNGAKLQSEIGLRLLQNRPIGDLVPLHDGRADLRGFSFPAKVHKVKFRAPTGRLQFLDRGVEVRNVGWENLDFSSGDLSGLKFFDSTFTNCCFDRCNCRGIRFWRCAFKDCSFRHADLRESLLGSRGDNSLITDKYDRVSFDGADLTNSVHFADVCTHCSFRKAKLNSLQFDGTVFEDCVFEGRLYGVQFFPHQFGSEYLPANKLKGCDFSKCSLEFVEFRNIDLVDVLLPSDDNHILLRHGGSDILAFMAEFTDFPQWVEDFLKTISERLGTPGIIHVGDLSKVVSESQLHRLREIASAEA